jgi:hypothetical protein
MHRVRGILLLLPLVALAACGRGEDTENVARAGDFRLTADDAAELLAPATDLPVQSDVLEALADFWADYVLLAWVVNREGELDRLDLTPVVRQQTEQEMVMRLRDQVIEPEAEVSDEELRAYFDEERPRDEVRARHVLLLYPDGATQTQRDSVQQLAEELRDRARAGADFAALAEEYSDDPGSAAQGGDLGYFPRGTMVPPFEAAAFGLEAGQVSDVVESQFGLHIIKSEDRRQPTYEEVEEELRDEFLEARTMRAESIYVADMEGRADVRLEDDALERLREITEDPDARLSSRAARRPLTRYEGGAYTTGQYREFLLSQDPSLRDQILGATDEQLEGLLRSLTRSQLLVEEARRRGIEIESGEVEEVRREMRREYRSAADFLGLASLEAQEGESLRDTVDREVKEFMGRLLRGEQDLMPLGHLSLPLRSQFGVEVSQPAIQRAVERVAALRNETAGEGPAEGAPGLELEEAPPADPDAEHDEEHR